MPRVPRYLGSPAAACRLALRTRTSAPFKGGGSSPPPGDAEFSEAPKAAEKIFDWPKARKKIWPPLLREWWLGGSRGFRWVVWGWRRVVKRTTTHREYLCVLARPLFIPLHDYSRDSFVSRPALCCRGFGTGLWQGATASGDEVGAGDGRGTNSMDLSHVEFWIRTLTHFHRQDQGNGSAHRVPSEVDLHGPHPLILL